MRLPVPPPRQIIWSGRRDSNPRPRPWQGRILPLNYFRIKLNGAGEGSRTPTPEALDPKSSVSASSTTPAIYIRHNKMVSHAGFEPATL